MITPKSKNRYAIKPGINYRRAPIKPRPKAATTPLAIEFTLAAPVKGAVPVDDGTEPVPVAVPVG